MRPLLTAEGSTLIYADPAHNISWRLPIESLILVAEYTTNEGPQADDYFLSFVTVENGAAVISTCGFYVEGRDDALEAISQHVGSPLAFNFTSSTAYASRIIWPSSLTGHKYFSYKAVDPRTLSEKLLTRLLGPELEYRFTEEVRAFIRSKTYEQPTPLR
jgi:hypothetical protein